MMTFGCVTEPNSMFDKSELFFKDDAGQQGALRLGGKNKFS